MCLAHIWADASSGSQVMDSHLTLVPRRRLHCMNTSVFLHPHVYIRYFWTHMITEILTMRVIVGFCSTSHQHLLGFLRHLRSECLPGGAEFLRLWARCCTACGVFHVVVGKDAAKR